MRGSKLLSHLSDNSCERGLGGVCEVLNGNALSLATQGAINETFCTGEIDTVTHGGSSGERGAGCGEWGVGNRERSVLLAGFDCFVSSDGPATSHSGGGFACPRLPRIWGSHIHRTRVICNMQYAMEPSKSKRRWKLFFPHKDGMASSLVWPLSGRGFPFPRHMVVHQHGQKLEVQYFQRVNDTLLLRRLSSFHLPPDLSSLNLHVYPHRAFLFFSPSQVRECWSHCHV